MKKTKNNSRTKLNALVKTIMQEKKHDNVPAPGIVTISWPVFDHKEITNALQSLIDLRISQGPKVRQFEDACAKYVGVKYAVAVNSGSSANLLALSALVASGIVPKGSEVILPATTFATVASPIIQVGLIPVYVDIDPTSWNIDPKGVEKAISPKTRVIMPVHTFGNPADMGAIMSIAKKHDLLVLEDCCEAHGAAIGGKKVGSFGDIATLSFFVAHNITTGEGGMIFTNDESMRDLLQSLREFGRLPPSIANANRFTYKDKVLSGFDARYIFTRIGYNVRMTDIAASLGIEQIKKLDALNAKRIATIQIYNNKFQKYEQFLELPKVAKGAFHSYYGYPFVVKKTAPFSRLEFVQCLESKGIETRPFFGGCLPDQPAFRDEPQRIVGELPVARTIRDQSVFIGCHPALTKAHVVHVIKVFASFFDAYL
ncbi:MAG: Glutamine--scyllo-inositol transaminase [Parcubacteria group bacterium Gr01-1014_8]|nr:MAG: Glutamine--scyllo-inositol transaminase [Parcubacteria group bacterium Gr01-1014_8]